jgi:hypothetical protein
MESGKKWMRFGALAACGLAVAAAWEFHERMILPLGQREMKTRHEIEELKGQVGHAEAVIAGIRALEKEAPGIRSELVRLQDEVPKGSAMVWLPKLVNEHFGSFGITVPLVRLNVSLPEPGLPGYEHDYWSVALPVDEEGRDIPTLLLAVADLDRANAPVRVLDFSIRPDPENPGGRIGSMNLGAIIPK